MRLNEYQVKRLLQEKKVLIPEGVIVERSSGYGIPAVGFSRAALKAQVPVSSRYKKGLVLFDTAKKLLSRQAGRLFKRADKFGACPYLLLEEKLSVKREIYMAVFSDPLTRRPMVVLDPIGGVDVEKSLIRARKHQLVYPVDILTGFDEKPFLKILRKAGFDKDDFAELLLAAKSLYELYREWDCRFVEINPLAKTSKGWVALDAKAELDEDAFFRIEKRAQSRVISLSENTRRNTLESKASRIDEKDYRGSAHFVQNDLKAARKRFGKKIKAVIGFNGVGTGASLTAMDELVRLGFFPRNFCDTSGNPPASKLYRATKIILSQPEISGYFFISCMSSQQLDNTARGIIKAFKERFPAAGGVPDFPALFLFRGAWDEEAKALFHDHGISRSEHVIILGRESSEADAAMEFARLYEKKR